MKYFFQEIVEIIISATAISECSVHVITLDGIVSGSGAATGPEYWPGCFKLSESSHRRGIHAHRRDKVIITVKIQKILYKGTFPME